MIWNKTDPRIVFDDTRRTDIIIVTPSSALLHGIVETHHGWMIDIVNPPSGSIMYTALSSGIPWPSDWQWTIFPAGPEIPE